MTRVCFVICGDLDVADEAVQAAWLIVWRKLHSLRNTGRLRPARLARENGEGRGPATAARPIAGPLLAGSGDWLEIEVNFAGWLEVVR